MKPITVQELALVAGTRAALGAGIALLLGTRLDPPQRRAVGWTLFAVGALSTIPIATEILRRKAIPADVGDGSPSRPSARQVFPE